MAVERSPISSVDDTQEQDGHSIRGRGYTSVAQSISRLRDDGRGYSSRTAGDVRVLTIICIRGFTGIKLRHHRSPDTASSVILIWCPTIVYQSP
jgi:hypothetical protein